MFFEEGYGRVQELRQTRLKHLLVLIYLFAQVLHRVEEPVQVQSHAVVLPLHVLEADVKVRLEELVRPGKLWHSGQF